MIQFTAEPAPVCSSFPENFSHLTITQRCGGPAIHRSEWKKTTSFSSTSSFFKYQLRTLDALNTGAKERQHYWKFFIEARIVMRGRPVCSDIAVFDDEFEAIITLKMLKNILQRFWGGCKVT